MMEQILAQIGFYIPAFIAVLATWKVISNTNPVHALLYMVISLLAIAMVFFSMGAPFAGALEVIVYAGAIMVLFVFVVMMLNLGSASIAQEKQWLSGKTWRLPAGLTLILLVELLYSLMQMEPVATAVTTVDAKQVGITLFGPYLLVVELASLLLLAALVAAYHLGRHDEQSNF